MHRCHLTTFIGSSSDRIIFVWPFVSWSLHSCAGWLFFRQHFWWSIETSLNCFFTLNTDLMVFFYYCNCFYQFDKWTATSVLLLQNLLVNLVECTCIPFHFQHHRNKVKVESKRGVSKLKGIWKNHCTTIPTVSPYDPWCDGEEVDKLIEKTSLTQSENWFVPHIMNDRLSGRPY
jgi:hypothetical protein